MRRRLLLAQKSVIVRSDHADAELIEPNFFCTSEPRALLESLRVCVAGLCLQVITTVILVSLIFLFNTAAHCMSLLVNNVCFYWYDTASGFSSLSSLTYKLIVIQPAWWLGSDSSDPKPAAAPPD